MNQSIRQELLQLLGQAGELAPDLRFGQLLANLAFLAAGPCDQTLWNLEDEQLLTAVQQFLANLAERPQHVV